MREVPTENLNYSNEEKVSKIPEVWERPQEITVWRSRPGVNTVNYEDQTISREGWSTYRVNTTIGPIHIKGVKEGYSDALLLPKSTQDLIFFESLDGNYLYLAVPNPTEDNYFFLPKGWEPTEYQGVIQYKKGEEEIETPGLYTTLPEDFARWASIDPFDDRVIVTFNRIGKANFVVSNEKEFTFEKFKDLPAGYVIEKEVVEKLGKKRIESEAVGITLDSLIETIKKQGIWGFPDSPAAVFYFKMDNPRLKDDKVAVGFVNSGIWAEHPRLNIHFNFSFSDFISRCREVATNLPTEVIPEELKEKLIHWNNVRPPSRKDAKYSFIDKEKLPDKNFREKYQNILSDTLESDPVRKLTKIYEPTPEEYSKIENIQRQYDSEYDHAMEGYNMRIKELEEQGYNMLWIGNTPIIQK